MLESLQSVLRFSPGITRPIKARRWALAAACGSFFYCAWASALGLGDITLQSALNQPFRAEIALIEPGDLADDELSVTLADIQEFKRAGVERLFFLNDLRFTPVLRGNRSFIRVESNKPVNEPFLNFLVQINRPNGNLLREYTVLLDPPGTVALPRPTPTGPASAANPVSRAEPLASAPPPASQGKRYTVLQGDNLWSIAKRLSNGGSQASISELMRGIRALNPGSERLIVGQSLLLPDSVQPGGAATAASQAPAQAEQNAEQLAASVLENQQLQQALAELQAKVQAQDEQILGSQKQVVELQTQLAEVKAAPASAPAAVPQAPVSTTPPVVVSTDTGGSSLLLLAALAVLLLLLALGLYLRRSRRAFEPSPLPLTPEPPTSPAMVSRVVAAAPSPVAQRVEPRVSPTPAANATPRSEPGESPDALEGVGIYIAYGRFTEAQAILREALSKEPERTDLRVRLLEVLAQQGDAAGYAVQEQHLLLQGFDAGQLEEIRRRYPKLASVPDAAPPVVAPLAAAALVAAPAAADEFQLNLDDLSMDADWNLVSPFDTPASRDMAAAPPAQAEVAPVSEPPFASNLQELPQVLEMPEEQFLSDFAEPEPQVSGLASEELDDDFLDGFKDDPEAFAFDEPQAMDFEALEREQLAADKLEAAQDCIAKGDSPGAQKLLHELLEEAPEPLKQVARSLLSSLR